jgi:hypothetical protein
MRNRIIYSIAVVFMLTAQVLKAQTVISGTVTSSVDGSPVEAAMVRMMSANKLIAFCLADKMGHYTIKANSTAPQLEISFERMSFTKKSVIVKNENQTLDVTLDENAVGLKEVTVRAPSVRQHGDTLTFKVADFVSKGDITLEDALKKIPGIEVGKNGQISYMNKSISKFYIEGLDMLDGKYTIATKNIPKSYVQSVEVLNNHKDVKMDKDNISNDVALNIKLSKNAKLKPMGTSAVTIGYGDRLLYQVDGMGMLFTPKFQSLITGKYGNAKQFSLNETTDFFRTDMLSVPASTVQGSLGGSRPPLDVDRYVNLHDGMLSANGIKKLGENTTLKLNATYAYNKTDYDYSIESKYYEPGNADLLVIEEHNTPGSRIHKPVIELEYKENSPTKYFTDKISVIGNFMRSTLLTSRDSDVLHQRKTANMVAVRNNFGSSFYCGKQKWGFTSMVNFTTAPTADMHIVGSTGKWDAIQNGNAKQFGTSNGVSTTFKWGRLLFDLPLKVNYTYDDSQTELSRQGESHLNRVYSNDLRLSSDLRLEYKTSDNRWQIMASSNINGAFLNQKNSATKLSLNKSKFYILPFAMVTWNMSATSAFTASGGLSQTYGDVLNLFSAPVINTYRTQTIHSGLLSEQKGYHATCEYRYTSVPKMWWVSGEARFRHNKNNIMSASTVDKDMITFTQLLAPSKYDNLLVQTDITKQLMSISTKLSMKLFFRWDRNNAVRNNTDICYINRSFGIQPSVYIHPIKWLEMDYRGSIVRQFNRYSGQEKQYTSQDHSTSLKLYPSERMEINASWNFMRKPVGEKQYKSMSLLDFATSYTKKRIRYTLTVNNILNTRHYSYNTFGGIDYFNYDYKLRGRELLFSISFTQ